YPIDCAQLRGGTDPGSMGDEGAHGVCEGREACARRLARRARRRARNERVDLYVGRHPGRRRAELFVAWLGRRWRHLAWALRQGRPRAFRTFEGASLIVACEHVALGDEPWRARSSRYRW